VLLSDGNWHGYLEAAVKRLELVVVLVGRGHFGFFRLTCKAMYVGFAGSIGPFLFDHVSSVQQLQTGKVRQERLELGGSTHSRNSRKYSLCCLYPLIDLIPLSVLVESHNGLSRFARIEFGFGNMLRMETFQEQPELRWTTSRLRAAFGHWWQYHGTLHLHCLAYFAVMNQLMPAPPRRAFSLVLIQRHDSVLYLLPQSQRHPTLHKWVITNGRSKHMDDNRIKPHRPHLPVAGSSSTDGARSRFYGV
jgi:hypothetical protein